MENNILNNDIKELLLEVMDLHSRINALEKKLEKCDAVNECHRCINCDCD
jgi:predicted nuclease with TOPRIM domain